MTIRVIAGDLRGRRIPAPRGRTTRPTPARVREAWFSALGETIRGSLILDLYAGTGALGIEALSRGARGATFVERDAAAARTLNRTLEDLGLVERSTVRRRSVERFIEDLCRTGSEFDIVLADPPYGIGAAVALVDKFREDPFASTLCVEHEPDVLDEVDARWQRRYGDTALSFVFAKPHEVSNEL
ncbi:MAG: 16S rRNA (guanine(966)-N(2))-methyltransferase RsmD [Gemmatimonadota bacterium]